MQKNADIETHDGSNQRNGAEAIKINVKIIGTNDQKSEASLTNNFLPKFMKVKEK